MTRASLGHYRGWYLVVGLAIALAVGALGGALTAGDSVRASLRAIGEQRLGNADLAVTTPTSFSRRLAAGMVVAAPDVIRRTVGLIVTEGTVTHDLSGRIATDVRIYGVDDAFWAFHDTPTVVLGSSGAALSPALATTLGARDGDTLLVRANGAGGIPQATLQGRRDPALARIPVTMARPIAAPAMGEFSLDRDQRPVMAVFVPLSLLQRALTLDGRVNTVLVQHTPRDGAQDPSRPPIEAVQRAWLAAAALPDHGLRIRRVPGDRVMALEGLDGVIGPEVVARVQSTLGRLGRPGVPALSYVVDRLRVGQREVPYSTVAAIDVDAYMRLSVPVGPPAPGTDSMGEGDPLVRGSLEVRVGRGGVRVGRVQVTEAERRAPAAAARQRGAARVEEVQAPPEDGPIWLNEWAVAELDARVGDTVHVDYFAWTDEGGLEARTASFELRGVQPMMRIGGDRTLTPDYPGLTDAPSLSAWNPSFPFDRSRIRPQDEAYWARWQAAAKAFVPLETGQRLWGTRFGAVSSIRFALGDAEAVAAAIRADTNTQITVRPVRLDATTAAQEATSAARHLLASSVVLVIAALLVAGMVLGLCIERRAREIALLASVGFTTTQTRRLFFREAAIVAAVGLTAGVGLAIGHAALLVRGLGSWWIDATGTSALTLRVAPAPVLIGAVVVGVLVVPALWWQVRRVVTRIPVSLARHPATAGPARRRLAVALVATGTFVLVGATAWHRDSRLAAEAPTSTTGGFALIAESTAPVMADPNTASGRAALGLDDTEAMAGVRVRRLRARPGDDTSVLNLYRPAHPRLTGVDPRQLEGRFRFADALHPTTDGGGATTDSVSPWRLLDLPLDDDIVPAIADEASLAGVFDLRVGDTYTFAPDGVTPVTFRIVAALAGSPLPSGLIIAERDFVRLFPRHEGYRLWLIEAPAERADAVASYLTSRLTNAGVRVAATGDHLASYDRVGNAWLAVFQVLTALGLLIGVVAVGAALPDGGAVVVGGVTLGGLGGVMAILPTILERGTTLPMTSLAAMLGTIVIAGLLASAAGRVARRRRPKADAVRAT